MASSTRPGRTAPKGRATRARNDDASGSLFGPTLQWIAAIVAILAVIGAIMYFGRDVRSTVGHGPAPVVVETGTATSV